MNTKGMSKFANQIIYGAGDVPKNVQWFHRDTGWVDACVQDLTFWNYSNGRIRITPKPPPPKKMPLEDIEQLVIKSYGLSALPKLKGRRYPDFFVKTVLINIAFHIGYKPTYLARRYEKDSSTILYLNSMHESYMLKPDYSLHYKKIMTQIKEME
jgi:hypothetical protein